MLLVSAKRVTPRIKRLPSHQSSLLQKPSSSHSFSSYEAAVVPDSTCAEVSESIIADIHSLGAPSSNYSSD